MSSRILSINIKRRRKELKISQETLAQMAGLGRSTIIEIEKGIGRTSIENIEKIANILGVPIYQLFSNERLYLESERITSDFCLNERK